MFIVKAQKYFALRMPNMNITHMHKRTQTQWSRPTLHGVGKSFWKTPVHWPNLSNKSYLRLSLIKAWWKVFVNFYPIQYNALHQECVAKCMCVVYRLWQPNTHKEELREGKVCRTGCVCSSGGASKMLLLLASVACYCSTTKMVNIDVHYRVFKIFLYVLYVLTT